MKIGKSPNNIKSEKIGNSSHGPPPSPKSVFSHEHEPSAVNKMDHYTYTPSIKSRQITGLEVKSNEMQEPDLTSQAISEKMSKTKEQFSELLEKAVNYDKKFPETAPKESRAQHYNGRVKNQITSRIDLLDGAPLTRFYYWINSFNRHNYNPVTEFQKLNKLIENISNDNNLDEEKRAGEIYGKLVEFEEKYNKYYPEGVPLGVMNLGKESKNIGWPADFFTPAAEVDPKSSIISRQVTGLDGKIEEHSNLTLEAIKRDKNEEEE